MTETIAPSFSSSVNLSSALLARGFFVDLVGSDIYLTDNAYLRKTEHRAKRSLPDDAQFLAATLKRLGLGSLIETGNSALPFKLSHPDGILPAGQLLALFNYEHVRRKDRYPYGAEDHYLFRASIHGFKIPIAALDSRIALLVKALSATGCFTFSSCDGYPIPGPHDGPLSLHVLLAGEINTAWAAYMLNEAIKAGLQLSLLVLDYDCDYLGENLTEQTLATRKLAGARAQAIELGRFLYRNRLLFRQQRGRWAETYLQRIKNKKELTKPTPESIRFRVRLSDATGFIVEFTVEGFRDLEERCRSVFRAWLSLNPDGERKLGRYDPYLRTEVEEDWKDAIEELASLETLMNKDAGAIGPQDRFADLIMRMKTLRENAEVLAFQRQLNRTPVLNIEIAVPAQQPQWRAPWGDPRPVRIRVIRTGDEYHPDQWRFVFRRTALTGDKSAISSWLLLWMGFREAVRN